MSTAGSSMTGDGRAAIDKTISVCQSDIFTNIRDSDLDEVFEFERCKKWILANNFKRICVQFPDEYLAYCAKLVDRLEEVKDDAKVFILSDSTYGSCCVDEKTAQHVPDADSIIHFGPSCLSVTSGRFPVLYIFTKPLIDLEKLENVFRSNFKEDEQVLILYDVIYEFAVDNLFDKLKGNYPLTKKSTLIVPSSSSVPDQKETGIVKHNRRIPCDTVDILESHTIFFVGQRSLPNLLLALPNNTFKVYDPAQTSQESVSIQTSSINKLIRKRSFYVEKIKDVTSVGILVGTLVVQNYLSLIDRLKQILKKAGKKYYTVSIGEINPCKLGNFMDIECFVFVGCPEVVNYYISDESKGQFFQPILTPYDVELAFCEGVAEKWGQEYIINWSFLVEDGDPNVKQIEEDVSLITGGMRAAYISSAENDSGSGVVNWRGLNENEEIINDPSKVYEGRSGVAASYLDEPTVN